MENIKLTDQEEKFCLVFACGSSPYNGNARKTFDLVFNGNTGMLFDPSETGIEEHTKNEVDVAIAVRRLMLRDDIRIVLTSLKARHWLMRQH